MDQHREHGERRRRPPQLSLAEGPRFVMSLARLVRQTTLEWMAQDVPRLGASLAFYTIFAIAPLFVIVLAIAGLWFGEEAARRELFNEVSGLVGSEGREAIEALVSAANQPKAGAWATVAALATLFIGVTGVFVELQDALNTVWGVRRLPGRGFHRFVKDRLLSFALVVGMGFLLLVSLVLSAGLSAFGKFLDGLLPAQEVIWQGVNFTVSFGVITVLFALVFKVLPDVKIAWRDVWIGAVITALLFNLGKLLIGLYLGRSGITSAYGAAGSLVVILMWVYYSSQILFFGAKFTQVYANEYGARLEPTSGASIVTTQRPAGAPRGTHAKPKEARV